MPCGRKTGWESERHLVVQSHSRTGRGVFQNLEYGATVDEFLEWFPGVTREQVGPCWKNWPN